MFGRHRQEAVMAYEDFVRTGVGLPSVWEGLRGQIYLGSEAFVESMQKLASVSEGTAFEIPLVQRRPTGRPLAVYAAAHGRHEAMARAYESGDYTMQQIASHFGVHYATVSRAVRQHVVRRSAKGCEGFGRQGDIESE